LESKDHSIGLALLIALSTLGLSAAFGINQQDAIAQSFIPGLGPAPFNQSSQSSNYPEEIIFDGESIIVFAIGSPYRQDRWQTMDSYASGDYDLDTELPYRITQDNNTLRTTREFIILER
jgi:hypothetical protein